MENEKTVRLDIDKICVAHEFVLNARNRCEYPNGRKYYGIIYCISGEARYRFSKGKAAVAKPGNVLWLSPDASYTIETKEDFRHYTVNFKLHDDSSEMGFLNKDFYLHDSDNHEMYRHIFKKLISCRSLKTTGSEMQAMACLYELCALFVSAMSKKETPSDALLRLAPAREYIREHFNSEMSLDLLANSVNMSVTNFRREWLKAYGETAFQYRDRLRILYAGEYLMSGYYSVTEIAGKCGFDDANYFIRFFKKHTGTTPGKFADEFK